MTKAVAVEASLVGLDGDDWGGADQFADYLDRLQPLVFDHIRQIYQEFLKRFGVGENPYFSQAPADAVFMNFHVNGRERPMFYVADEVGDVKPWLTKEEVERLSKPDLSPEQIEAVAYDMFTMMLGGIEPELSDLGFGSLLEFADTLSTSFPEEIYSKIRKIFDFVRVNPNTNLTEWLNRKLGLSFSAHNIYKTRVANRDDKVIIMGKGCFDNNMLIVWHVIRNMREGSFSHLKYDGEVYFPLPFDIQLVYMRDGIQRVVRLNSTVFFLARHGLSEEESEETSADQVYVSLDEYWKYIYIHDEERRRQAHQRREENFAIHEEVEGYEKIIESRKAQIVGAILKLDEEGQLDQILSEIDGYKEKSQGD